MNNLNLRKARKSANLTQEQLAQKLGVNRATISKYESGIISPTADQLIKICKTLDISYTELLDEGVGLTPSQIHQSMQLEDYLKSYGYEFHDSYPDIDSQTTLCVDRLEKKLYLVNNNALTEFENSIHSFTKFQINELLNRSDEIPDTEGWLKQITEE